MRLKKENTWNYLTIGWVLLFPLIISILFLLYPFEIVAVAGFLLFPFILCGFFIPFFIFYERSNLSFPAMIARVLKVRSGRSKNIHYLCIIMVPLTILFILILIFFPESFLEYSPEYGKNYVYNLTFLQIIYLIAYIGYWKEQRWGIYLYITASVTSILVLNYGLKIPFGTNDFTWNLFIIAYGIVYMPKGARKRS
jgi:hypothetical protein